MTAEQGRSAPTGTRDRSEICAEICARIAAGETTARIFATGDRRPDYPDRASFWRWRCADKALQAQFIEAMRDRALLYAEEIAELADTEPRITDSEKFGSSVDRGWVAWNNTRIDVRKWHAARLHSSVFGDRTIVAGDADNPIRIDDARTAIASKLLPDAPAEGPPATPGEPE